MALTPILPVIEGESLTSYLNRMAKFHGNMEVYQFLDTIELARGAAMMPKESDFDRLISLTGLSEQALSSMTFRPVASRQRRLAGEVVHAEFANLEQTCFCPACLLEDEDAESASAGIRVGRIAWRIDSVRACGRHGIELVRRKNTNHSEFFQLMSAVAPDTSALRALVSGAQPCTASRLQDYVLDRLAGKSGPEWLDTQPIDLAVRACEMLGIGLTKGTDVELRNITNREWLEAADAAFEFVARGEKGVREALDIMMSSFRAAGFNGGPQKAFGFLYRWLQFNKNGKPYGAIREVVREFILDNFAIAPGTQLLGEIVDRQRMHSVQSLARATRQHPKTVNHAIVLAGLAEGDPDRQSPGLVFDAEAGLELMNRIQNSIPVTQLQFYLNCNRTQAEQLARSGTIPRLLPDQEKANGVLKNIALSDADAFLDRLLGAAKAVKIPSFGMMDIVAAAEISRWPVIDIVTGILSGMFEHVEIVDRSQKFKAVMVDPVEVRDTLFRAKSEGFVGVEQAANLIGMPIQGFNNLVKLKTHDGAAYVTEHHIENGKGRPVRLFPTKDIERFRREHISLKEHADRHAISQKVMKMKLDARGIQPITPRFELGRVWYRVADLSD